MKNSSQLLAPSKHMISNSISPREQEIVNLICDGLTTKEIANKLHISPHTVDSHKKNLMNKVGAKNTVQMVYKTLKSF